jgi:hypothetical protein
MFIRPTPLLFSRSLMAPRLTLATETLGLRQQLTVLNRSIKRPQLYRRDQFFMVMLSRLRKNWLEGLIIVKPETVVKWRKERSRLYCRWKSKPPVGLQQIDKEIRVLIRRMTPENPLWQAPRIQDDCGRPLRRFRSNRLKSLTTPAKTRAHRRKAERPPSGVHVVS